MSKLLLRKIPWKPVPLRSMVDHATTEKFVEIPTTGTWKIVSMFVALPTCGYLFYKNILLAEHKHEEEVEKPAYSYMNIQKKPYPWGEGSLFSFKKKNVDEGEVKKENFITAWIRKLQEDHVKEDWKVQVNSMNESYAKIIEHIEKKKFPQYPVMPSYGRLFGYPLFDPQDPKRRLPGGFDD